MLDAQLAQLARGGGLRLGLLRSSGARPEPADPLSIPLSLAP